MIEEALKCIQSRIQEACKRSGRNHNDVTLIAVTKTVPADRIRETLLYGIKDIGENKVQEAQAKFPLLSEGLAGVRKHYIGHLQTNKVKKAVELFDVIQSLDSIRLAEEIDSQARKAGKLQDCLIEIKVSGEESKFGLDPALLLDFLSQVRQFKCIRVSGLMAMAPFFEDPEQARPYFKAAKEAFDKARAADPSHCFNALSMGMSNDFEVAIEEGATMVRVGTAIFGER